MKYSPFLGLNLRLYKNIYKLKATSSFYDTLSLINWEQRVQYDITNVEFYMNPNIR